MKTSLLIGLIVGGIYFASYADSCRCACSQKADSSCHESISDICACGSKKGCPDCCSGLSSPILSAQNSCDTQVQKIVVKNDQAVKIVELNDVEKIVTEKLALIFDARTGKWDDGSRIPGAKTLSAENSEDEIRAAIPDKNQPVLVYCASKQCPASRKLAEKLISLGYSNVMEYSDGIKGWRDAGKEIEKTK